MAILDPAWIMEELNAAFRDSENALSVILNMDKTLLYRKNEIDLAFDQEIPDYSDDGNYARLTVMGGYYTRGELAAHFRELFLKAFLDLQTGIPAVPGEPDWLKSQEDFLSMLRLETDIHLVKIKTIQDLYPSLDDGYPWDGMAWLREHILTLPEDTLCFNLYSCTGINNTWLVISDGMLVLVDSYWTD